MGLDPGGGALLRCLFERCNRLARTSLRQEADAKEMERLRVPGIARQRIAGEPLGFVWTLLLKRTYAAPQNLLDLRGRAVSAP